MKHAFLIGLMVFTSALFCAGQTKWKISDYHQYTASNFRSCKMFSEPIDFNSVDYQLLDAAVFYVTNEIRVEHHLNELTYNKNLEVMAWNHSKQMMEKNFFSHTNPKDKKHKDPQSRALMAGITNPMVAENIARTYALQYKSGTEVYIVDKDKGVFSYTYGGDPIKPHTYLSYAESLVDQWMHSPPHKENILNKSALQLGVGCYLYYDHDFYNMPGFFATQNFQWTSPVVSGTPSDVMDGYK